MSKHVGRKQRWTREDARRYSSALGQVFYEQNGWYALLEYRTLATTEGQGGLPVWVPQRTRLGPFKRPRNAMVALEREATALRNRHGENVLLAGQLWGEA